mmetsp:Transcript_42020/g.71067  ORF Transcript_42020/g.71067 Transcript_42020/m.71067 type:complete len:87 (+) Transcript_42020:374-634(+)
MLQGEGGEGGWLQPRQGGPDILQTHRYRAPLQTMRIKEPKRGEEHRTCLGSPQPMSICIGLYKVEGLDHGFHAKKQVLRLEQQPVL